MSPSPTNALLVALCGLTACGGLDYRYGDLELVVEGPLPAGAETLRLCIEGFGATTTGAGNGRAAVTGLAVDQDYTVVVDVLDPDGSSLASAGPASLDAATPYTTTPLLAPSDSPCTADGSAVEAGQDSWLFVLHFDETGTPWDNP